jgi:2,3-bisphosphoglycerate-independent phosphoglycerate mutase
VKGDSIETFSEESCKKGSYGLLEGEQFIIEFFRI